MTKEEAIEKRLAAMPVKCRGHYEKAMRGRSMKAAITAQCLECVLWVRKEVELCTDVACPLYPYRPFQVVRWKARSVKHRSRFSGRPMQRPLSLPESKKSVEGVSEVGGAK
jgi:hypothetical protein